MQPEVRFTRASDGVSVAYWKHGEGPVLVQGPLIPFSHIEMEWQNPYLRRWYETLGEFVTIVRYDGRGTGMSSRTVDDVSLEAHTMDLEAVVDAVSDGPVSLIGVMHSGPPAVAYAAAHPERVFRLILWCTYHAGSGYWAMAQSEGLRVLRQTDYALFLRTAAHELLGWSEDEEADRYAALMAAAVSPDEADRLLLETRGFNVTSRLAAVSCPTLVLHRRELQWLDGSLSRDLAAHLGDARLKVIDGRSPLPGTGAIDGSAESIAEFLDIVWSRSEKGTRSGFRAVLFTDLVDHARMMRALGDEEGRTVLREHEQLTRQAISQHGGAEVKAMGDGFMASFSSVNDAVQCAVDLQHAVSERNMAGDPALAVRIGISAGEPIEEDGDLFGATVILASRISAQAGPGEILVSNAVQELSAGRMVRFDDRGMFEPKGFGEPVRIWAVDWSVGD